MNHPSQFTLEKYAQQLLDEREADSVHEHLDVCRECEVVIHKLEANLRGKLTDASASQSGELAIAASDLPCMLMVDAICDHRFQHSIQSEELPRTIGNYELKEMIGQGGMGVVYLATHLALQRDVAVKLVHINRLGNSHATNRFQREIIASGRLQHPNIVHVLDAGDEDGVHYLVMELLEGKDVSRLRKSRGMTVANACEIVRQAALGIHQAHTKKLIHRDIKPSNLFLSAPSGGRQVPTVKVLDLGLAVLSGGTQTAEDITQTGHAVGTLQYMAPEQFQDARAIDHRADIFSLGMTLLRLLDQQDHVTARNGMAFLHDDGQTAKALRKLNLPKGLVAALRQSLAADPTKRFASAADLAKALYPYCESAELGQLIQHDPEVPVELGATQGAQSPRPLGRLTWQPLNIAGGVAAAALICVAYFLGWFSASIPDEINFSPPLRVSELCSSSVDEMTYISPDGLYAIIESSRENGITRALYATSRPTTEALFERPDGQSLAGLKGSAFDVRTAVMNGANEIFYHTNDNDTGGRTTFFRSVRSGDDGAFPEGSYVESASLAPKGASCYHLPQWISEDGLRLYYLFENRSPRETQIDRGARRLYVIERESVDAEFGQPSTDPFAKLNDAGITGASLSADELELFFSSERPGGQGGSDIWYASRKSTDDPFDNPINVEPINSEKDENSPKLLGDTLYFSSGDATGRDIYITKRATSGRDSQEAIKPPVYGEATLVEELSAAGLDIVNWISPDGKQLIIQSDRENLHQVRLYLASLDEESSKFTEPDARLFAQVNDSGYSANSGVMSPDFSELFYLSSWSGDGQRSFFRTARHDATSVFPAGEFLEEVSMGPDGGRLFHYPMWMSHDGLRLYFLLIRYYSKTEKFPLSRRWYVAARPSISEPFGKPSDAVFRNVPHTYIGGGSLSSDELEFYFTARRNGEFNSDGEIWYCRRNHSSEPFCAPVRITSLNTALHESYPKLSGDKIYFSRGEGSEFNIYCATRLDKQP